MLHIYVRIFDMMGTVENFLETKQGWSSFPAGFGSLDATEDQLMMVLSR